ncbi:MULTISPECIES: DUF1648 domain-containing protein [unclassified Streptomyces]|uniref:DUF1648 domain-containing protein n=1 Tax=unclassified Streptomyces TaxID=2593676 RepID=UPI0027E478AD|nr:MULTISPECIES: DUF1648 domain-containing protein [unclassified Streptomyces]
MAGWAAGILVLLVTMPLAARDRLPRRLATHWGASGGPDGSLPLWAATLAPALIWAVLVGGVACWRVVRGWAGVTLLPSGVLLAGAQASIVRANLDRSDWREADSVTAWAVATVAVAAAIGLAAFMTHHRQKSLPAGESADGRLTMEIPEGERRVWLSRAANPWLSLTGAVSGVVAVAAWLVGVVGLTELHWALVAPFAFVSVLVLGCSSVRARVTERGLEVAFGPFGHPVRRWAAEDIESARVEHRTAAQVGGWGYRLSGLGTTVMLRGGECLVIRAKGKDFAISVDDATRGAALLNSLATDRPGRP